MPEVRRAIAFLWTVLWLHLAFLLLVFFATRQDLAWHLLTAFHRLAWQSLTLYAVLLFVCVSALLRALAGAAQEILWSVRRYRYRMMQ